MTKQKSTKRALLMSALSLLVCVSMLIGSTFAWFTDSVTSAGNIIKSGTLDVTMEWADGTKEVPADESTDWKNAAEGAIFKSELWEPGYTEVRHIKIANEGTLALKYQLNILANGEVSELADVIDVYYLDPAAPVAERTALTADKKIGTLTEVLANISTTASGELKATEKHTVTLALKMQETAGNEYQDLAIGSDFSIQLLATQLTAESDSFDDQYDKFADYDGEISSEASLKAAVEKGGTYQLKANIALSEFVSVAAGKTLALDLAGNSISAGDDEYALVNENGGTLIIGDTTSGASTTSVVEGIVYTGANSTTIINGGTYNAEEGGKYVLLNNGGSLTINSATINGGSGYPIYNYGANNALTINDADVNATFGCINANGANSVVAINGGTYTMTGYESTSSHIAYFANGDVTINGGTFEKIGDISMSAAGGGGICAIYGANITVNGGTFSGDYADFYDWGGKNANGRSNTISLMGGTYAHNPASFVADGYVAAENADGTYTVSKKIVPEGTTLVSEGLYVDADGVYYITKVAGFDAMREQVASEQPYEKDGTWILYNDIDLNGVNWTPIAGFHGIFDGNNKTISNMNASFLAESTIGGTDFGVVCTIKDVTFHKATITGTEGVGVVVSNGVGVTIENVKVTESTVIGTKYVGGIVGVVNKAVSTITGCSVTGSTIKADGENANGKVGGIVGFLSVGKATGNTVTGCTISGPECVGGIAGRGGSGDGPATIYGNTVSGNTVTGTDTATVGEQIGDALNVKDSE